MKEHPILFSGDMVRAILEGRKTQTRRVINWERLHKQAGLPFPTKCKLAFFLLLRGWGLDAGDSVLRGVACPYGTIGDRLWVRETHSWFDPAKTTYYRATDPNPENPPGGRWRPSIHMPRWASRITLEVKRVCVKRVQDITDAQALAEGCVRKGLDAHVLDYPAQQFERLWDSINGKPRKDGVDISWAANPWVWVVEFQRVTEGCTSEHGREEL